VLAGATLIAASVLSLLLIDRWLPSPSHLQIGAYEAAWGANNGTAQRPIDLFRRALKGDPASPYRWSDLAEALAANGDITKSRQAFARSLELGPSIPQIHMRYANALFMSGRTDDALLQCAKVLESTDSFDEPIFSSFVRMGGDIDRVLRMGIARNARVAEAFFEFLIPAGRSTAVSVEKTWRWINGISPSSSKRVMLYTNFLAARKEFADASAIWALMPRSPKSSQQASTLLYNGAFQSDPLPTLFDWSITPVAGVLLSFDRGVNGGRLLKLEFLGDANLDYHGISQQTWLSPGRYLAAGELKTEALSTDQGISLRVVDSRSPAVFDAFSSALVGTHDWTRLAFEAVVPPPARLVRVEIVRRPSSSFENRIRGTTWIRCISLTRIDNQPPSRSHY